VADEFVGKPKGTVLYPAATDDDGALVGRAANQTHIAEHGFVFAKAEGAGGCDEAGIVAGLKVADEGFVADRVGEVDGVVDGVAFAGIDADEFSSLAYLDGLEDAEVLALAALALEAGAENSFYVGQGAAIEDGDFEVVDFDDNVVDAEADEGGEQVLGGRDEDALAHERGGVGDFRDVAACCRNLEVVQVCAAEHDAGASGCRDEAEGDFCARVQPDAREVERGLDGVFELGIVRQKAYLGNSTTEAIKTQATSRTPAVRCGFLDTVRWRCRFVVRVGRF